MQPYLRRDADAQGAPWWSSSAFPSARSPDRTFTHHQLMTDYQRPLGDGNNMFVSVSAPGDTDSAGRLPPRDGLDTLRAGTVGGAHTRGLSRPENRKPASADRLARRAYPELGPDAVVHEVATPRTYERFTGRPRGP